MGETEDSEATPDPPAAADASASLAERSPWVYAILSGLLVSALWAGVTTLHGRQQPLPIGRAESLADFRFTLKSFECDRRAAESRDAQPCTAEVVIRNDGDRAAHPKVTYTLFVNEQQYDGRPADVFGEIFPDRTKNERVAFATPWGVAPTRLIIAPYASFSDFVPFWQTEIAYDLP